jgi:hypothetical protein
MVEMPEEEEDEDAPARYEDSSDDGYDSDEEASRAEDYDGESDYGDDLEDIINYHKNAIQEETENHMLRGFRWMLQRETEDEEEDNDESDADASDSDNEDDAEASDDEEQVDAVAGALAVEDAGAVVGELETGCSISNTEQWLQHVLPMFTNSQLLLEEAESSEDELEEDE